MRECDAGWVKGMLSRRGVLDLNVVFGLACCRTVAGGSGI